MKSLLRSNTFKILTRFIIYFLLVSFLIRAGLLLISLPKIDLSFLGVVKIFLTGAMFDFGVALFFSIPYTVYLLLLPTKWSNSLFNKIVTYSGFFLVILITMFSFFAEITFWDEFQSRFNFIAVDYLVYTYEVIHNINESYPLPLLIGGMIILSMLVVYIFIKRSYFKASFNGDLGFGKKALMFLVTISISLVYIFSVNNSFAESGKNRFADELSKAGIYSFFAAFKNNELNFDKFYRLIDNQEAFKIVRNELADSNTTFVDTENSIRRHIQSNGTELHPNVIMITIESFSAGFMSHYGNRENITPVMDSLWEHSLRFNNLYATGTRTVRGMEALTLSVPPTPGNSIVRRPRNGHLSTVGSIFKSKGYETHFFYGGDGYFDNMNQYFGSNGYSVTDRGRNLTSWDNFDAPRYIIPDSAVQFENAWGICDEDLYKAVERGADSSYSQSKPFYFFVMTTSNHRPYTYPPGRIDIPSGSGRKGAVRYTDYAIGKFLQDISKKPWFQNTIVILVADHCASSAGKDVIDVAKYHIPAMVVNSGIAPLSIDKLCSQIDIYPTLFSLLHWSYESNIYGKDVLSPGYQERAFLGTYQTLGYLKRDSLVLLAPQQNVDSYLYDYNTNQQKEYKPSPALIQEAIANYQTAYFLYKNGGLKSNI